MLKKNGKLNEKRFFLFSLLSVLMMVVFVAIGILFFDMRIRDMNKERHDRLDVFAKTYSDEFSLNANTLMHLSSNNLVHTLRYNSGLSVSNIVKYKALINAIKFAESTGYSEKKYYVYFHDTDSVITSQGRCSIDEVLESYELSEILDRNQFKTDRTKRVYIFKGATVFAPQTYKNKIVEDTGTVYAYTDDGVTIFAVCKDQPIYEKLETAIGTGDTKYVVWDSVSGSVLFSNVPELKQTQTGDIEKIKGAFGDKRNTFTADNDRMLFCLNYDKKIDENYYYEIMIFLLVLFSAGLIMLAVYYFLLDRSVFVPMKRILNKFEISSADSKNIFAAMENLLENTKKRIENEVTTQDNTIIEEGAFVNEADENREEGNFALISLIAENSKAKAEAQRMLESFAHIQMYAEDVRGFTIYKAHIDDEEAYSRLVENEIMPVCGSLLGVSEVFSGGAEISGYIKQTMETVNCPYEDKPEVFVYGKSKTDYTLNVPVDTKSVGLLLNTIVSGDSASAVQFITDAMGMCKSGSTAQKRFCARYLAEVISIGQNSLKEPVYYLNMVIAEIDKAISYEKMIQIVTNACSALSNAFSASSNDDDDLMTFIIDYVEKNYMQDIYLKTVAEKSGMSYAYVSHMFSVKKGMGFNEYLNSVRVKKAEELLVSTSLTISEIAAKTGFAVTTTFTRNFKKCMGMTPDAYRKINRAKPEK